MSGAYNIGGMTEVGALADTDMLEIERPDGDPPTTPNSWWRVPALKIAAYVINKIVPGSGVRASVASGELTLSSAGAAKVSITASTTLGLTHADRFIECNNTGNITITIPPQASVAWAADTQLEGAQWNTGTVTFAAGSGVTIRKHADFGLTVKGRYAPWGLKRIAENEWLLFGLLGTA